MGAKSLGEQMGVDENDAACYIESFKARYTGRDISVCVMFCFLLALQNKDTLYSTCVVFMIG